MDLNRDLRPPVARNGGGEAERLNGGCFCVTIDRKALIKALNEEVGSRNFAQALIESNPTLFSNVPTFVPSETLRQMARVIDAVEAVARLPGYRQAVLSWAPPIAGLDFGHEAKTVTLPLGAHAILQHAEKSTLTLTGHPTISA